MTKPGSVITIVGPPTNGKTCLAASWTKFPETDHPRNIIWYQINNSDADIANFFQLVGDVTAQWDSPTPILPSYRAEAFANFGGFTTAWLKALFRIRHRASIAFIFDDIHRLVIESELTAILTKMVQFLSGEDRLILLSRDEIPAPIVNAARRRRRLVEIRDLRITESEFPDFEASAVSDTSLTQSAFLAALQYSGNYMAGLPLLGTVGLPEAKVRENLLELITQLSTSERAALMTTAYVQVGLEQEWVAVGGKLAIKALYKIESDIGLVGRLQNQAIRKHDIFFETLRIWTEANASPETLTKARLAAGRMLVRRGDVLSGVQLLVAAEAYEETRNAVSEHAARLIDLAKNKELLDIIAALPTEERSQPEIQLWAAYASLPFSPEKAATDLAAIRSNFSGRLSVSERALAINGEIYSALSTMIVDDRMPPLIDAATDLTVELTAVKEPERSRLFIGRLVAILLGAPTDNGHGAIRREAEAELQELSAESKLILGAALVTHLLWWEGDVEKARDYHRQITEQAQHPDAAHLPVMSWHFSTLGLAFRDGDAKAFAKALKEVEDFAEHRGLDSRLGPAYWMATQAYAAFGNEKAAGKSLSQHLALVQEMRELHEHEGYFLRSAIALGRGDFAAAADEATQGWEIADRHDAIQGRRQNAVVLAMSLAFKGDSAAEPAIHEITQVGQETENRVFLLHAAIAGAALAHTKQRWDIFATQWKDVIELSQSTGIKAVTGFNAEAIGRLAGSALGQGVDPEGTTQLIASWRLLPPVGEPVDGIWPYRLDVKCFGTDVVQATVFEDSRRTAAKTHAKTGELLSLLIVSGSRGISQQALINELWPDRQLADVGNNLRQQIKKLRNLTTYEGVQLADGQYSLNNQLIMSDVQRLNEAVHRFLDLQVEISGRVLAFDYALGLYEGPLLAGSQLALVKMHRNRIATDLNEGGSALLAELAKSDPAGAVSRRQLLAKRLGNPS